MNLHQAFELALGHHQSGRLAEAEAIYRRVLAAEPRQADALHMPGVLAHQVGRKHHFSEVHVGEFTVRKEGAQDVAGWLVVLGKAFGKSPQR